MPTFCEPCPGKRNASLPILHLLDLSRSYRRRPSISHGAPAGLSPAVAPARLLVTRCVLDGFLSAAVAAGPRGFVDADSRILSPSRRAREGETCRGSSI